MEFSAVDDQRPHRAVCCAFAQVELRGADLKAASLRRNFEAAAALLIKGEAHREGVLALLEKRPAVFD